MWQVPSLALAWLAYWFSAGAELQPLRMQKSNTKVALVGKHNNGHGFILTTQGISHNENDEVAAEEGFKQRRELYRR